MSDVTDALFKHLLADLRSVLDEFQIGLIQTPGSLIWPDATPKQAQAFFLGKSLLKKFNEKDYPSSAACDAALIKFNEANTRSTLWSLRLESLRDEELVNGVRDVIYHFFYPEGDAPLIRSYDHIFNHGNLGSGMNRYARDSDLYTKVWDSPLTCTTEDLSFLWEKLTSRDTRWAIAEKLRLDSYSTQLVEGNKLSFVNKNVTVARCISTEPTINMWFQLGIGAIIEERLKTFFGINVSNQPDVNRVLSYVGSRDDSFSTIDLESASDSISLQLTDILLPKSIRAYLYSVRSPTVTLPCGRVERLGMVSTMGNGYTFPLQTLIFAAVVVTAYKHLGIKPKGFGPAEVRNFGVFGDDIIIDKKAYYLVTRILSLLGFRVNYDKTFVQGPFRESCGADFYLGHPCRGVYIKKLQSKQDTCVAVNALNRWSATTGIILQNTVGFLLSRARGVYLVPCDEADDAGIHVPFDKACGTTSPYPGLIRYRKYQAVVSYIEVKDDGTLEYGQRAKRRKTNPHGLVLAFLYGAIRGYRISLRQRNVRYRTKHRTTPSWDSLSPRYRALGLDWQRWSDAVFYNIT